MKTFEKYLEAVNGEITLKSNIRRDSNRDLHIFNTTYYPEIPLSEIFEVLKKYDIVPIQEDGAPWQGFLTGKEGNTQFRLKNQAGADITNSVLILTWYKMPSNNYEVVVYLS